MSFNCTGCGLCCTKIGKIKATPMPVAWMQAAVDAFPYESDETGACEKLVDNKCSVYENRPLLCNIERMADELDIGMTKEQWFAMNYQGCKVLQEGAQ
jgi:Fe-S-cluster containining protein